MASEITIKSNTADQTYQEDFIRIRSRLFALAYKMTKSIADAEDILQETFLAIGPIQAGSLKDPEAYFVRIVINLCLKLLHRRKDIIYPGPDLPEPMADDWPQQFADEDISYGLLLLLQQLKPFERGVFILRESLGMKYDRIAEIMSSKPGNCRQILHRAKEKLCQAAPFRCTSEDGLAEFMDIFLTAVTSGDHSLLIARLREDVILYTDGGGQRPAALKPVIGAIPVLKYMIGIYNKWSDEVFFAAMKVNGESAVVLHHRHNGLPDSVTFLNFDGISLAAVFIIRNPDKLKGILNRPV